MSFIMEYNLLIPMGVLLYQALPLFSDYFIDRIKDSQGPAFPLGECSCTFCKLSLCLGPREQHKLRAWFSIHPVYLILYVSKFDAPGCK